MTGEYKVRAATAADAGIIAEHRRAMFADMGERDQAKLDAMEAESVPWLQGKISSGSYFGWFAVAPDGSIAAGAGIWLIEWPPSVMDLRGRRGTIFNVYTVPGYRGRGLARCLMESILAWCGERGIRVVNLHASDAGRPLYEALGFRATNEMRMLLDAQ